MTNRYLEKIAGIGIISKLKNTGSILLGNNVRAAEKYHAKASRIYGKAEVRTNKKYDTHTNTTTPEEVSDSYAKYLHAFNRQDNLYFAKATASMRLGREKHLTSKYRKDPKILGGVAAGAAGIAGVGYGTNKIVQKIKSK